MPVVYFDNFRGFNKTFLPLKRVNFFVGENSSGKTSVLKLIKILSDHKFWFTQEFYSEEAELGYFSEIVSYANSKNSYYEIGILGDKRDKEEGIGAIKIRFENKDGIPSVSQMCVISSNINIQVQQESGKLKYRYSIINIKNITEVNKLKYFKKWIDNNELSDKPFISTNNASPFYENVLLFNIQAIIYGEIEQASVNKDSVRRRPFKLPNFLQDVAWLAPIRTDPKRTYDSYKITFNPDGTHAPYLLKKLLSDTTSKGKKRNAESILQKFGKDSGLFDNIVINPLGEGDTSPFELQVMLQNKPLKITNVGYGVSQILPLIIEVISRPKNTWFAIQQPEIHLHPRAQAAFGDFVFKSALNDDQNFIIETHSDYTIDRFRLKLHEKEKGPKIESQIVFFRRNNGLNELVSIPISPEGIISDEQPSEFREFFIKEQLDILQI